MYMSGLIIVVGFGGAGLLSVLSGSPWKKMQDGANLTLEDSGIFGNGTYTGVIRGRPVRARTKKRKTGQSTEGGSNKTTYTITEADLRGATDRGILISRDNSDSGRVDVGESTVDQTVINGEFVVTGAESEQFARELLTQEAREAIRALEESNSLTIGDAGEAVISELPAPDSKIAGFLTGKLTENLATKLGGSATTVAIETKGTLGDSAELNRRITAVAAVADAFEESQIRE